jgi:ATP-binding cassette subfamily F protein uup
MNLLSVENISRSYGERVLFKDVSFGLAEGDKVALVARNGAGKSTLLNILSGKDSPDSGRVSIRRDLSIGMLEQEPVFDLEKSVIEAVLDGGSEIFDAVKEYESAADAAVHDHGEQAQLRLQEATARMDAMKAWDHETRLKTMLSKLGFDSFTQKVGTLSGGQKKRLALVRLLISEPQLLILDEPTNHLDIDMIEWLEHYLSSRDLTLLLVTHDRYFLDRVCDRIIELDNSKLYNYDGDFAYYIERKAEREEAEASSLEKAKNLFRRELAWVRKMPRARGTKAKARKDAFKDVAEKAKGRRPEEELKLEVKMTRLGGKIIELIRLCKSFGDKTILKSFDYTFKRGEKIGVVGKNGAGKTTLLNIIMGTEPFDSGKIQAGETVVFGYYAQHGMKLADDKRVIEVVKDIADVFPLADGSNLSASQMLQRFLFPVQSHYSYVSLLSGGEKRRLYLLTVLMKNPNFLILDEPTNDLDILTLSVLEDFLADFPGCVMIVSHDRYFMDKLVDHLFVFEGDGVIRDFPGNYSQWREKQQELEKKEVKTEGTPAIAAEGKPAQAVKDGKRKPSFKEKFEFEQLDTEIPKLEKEKAEITEKMATLADHAELQKLSVRFAEVEAQLDEKTLRWMELAELMET